ncbi:uncharacterized protein RJT21DRAFT_124357 [Scheffersomyces amazonensis]|uniref:uncharacterized protein n=1 Tax=Scheffersomyces amazonensis TaxID=1078765 RepID=UPI00315D0DB6
MMVVGSIRRFSNSVVRFGSGTLSESITNFISTVKLQQENAPSLLGAIDKLIDKHQDSLIRRLNIEKSPDQDYIDVKQKIWDHLGACDHDLYQHCQRINESRRAVIESNKLKIGPDDISAVNNFITQLYPLHNESAISFDKFNSNKYLDIPSMITKYELINHNQLYHTYYELPYPQAFHLDAKHVNDFIEKFLFKKRDFRKPNIISELYLEFNKDPESIDKFWQEMMKKRLQYVRMISKILNDFKSWGIPININEQNELIKYIFFRDSKYMIDKYHEIIASTTIKPITSEYSKFNLKTYQDLKQSILNNPDFKFDDNEDKLHINSFNTFLYIASQHDNFEVVKSIIEDLKLSNLIDEKKVYKNNSIANTRTFKLLLEYFATSKQEIFFTNTLDFILDHSSSMIIDINVINSILDSLIKLNRLDLAEQVLSQLFLSEIKDKSDIVENEEDAVYRQLSLEDIIAYNKLMLIYRNLKALTNDKDIFFKFQPTGKTFELLINQYCGMVPITNSFNKVRYLLSIMEVYYGLPTNTKLFTIIFKKFKSVVDIHNEPDWSDLNELINFVIKLINLHDYSFNLTPDSSMFIDDQNMSKIDKLGLSTQLKNFVNDHLNLPKETLEHLSIPKGNFVKLSNNLIDLIYGSILHNLSSNTKGPDDIKWELIRKIKEQKYRLDESLKTIQETDIYRNDSNQIYKIDEINYIKKGFLIDLIDLFD